MPELLSMLEDVLADADSDEEKGYVRHLLGHAVPDREFARAVEFLLDNLSPVFLARIYENVKTGGEDWDDGTFHMTGGMGVRSLLWRGGFYWDAVVLDDLCRPLLNAAARLHVEEGRPAGTALTEQLPRSQSLLSHLFRSRERE